MDKIILYIITGFFIIGALDYAFGDKLKIGQKFNEGISTMGPMFLAIAGIYSLTPVMAKILSSIFMPVSKALSLDPSLFPSMILAIDMGGYSLSETMALSSDMKLFSGVLLASTLGTLVSFTLPVAMSIIDKKDVESFIKGTLAGIITIPIVCFIGGVLQGINMKVLLWNLTPVLIITILIIISMKICCDKLVKVLAIIGKCITYIGMVGLVLQGINIITGSIIVPNLVEPQEVVFVAGKMALVLAGAYPMISVISRVFHKAFRIIGRKLGADSTAVVGILGGLASNLLIFTTLKDMKEDGKIIACAFAVGGAFIFGGQLGFVSSKAPEILGIFIIVKLLAGIIAIAFAEILFIRPKRKKRVIE